MKNLIQNYLLQKKLKSRKNNIKKIIAQELRKRIGSVNDLITRRELVEDLKKLLISTDNLDIICNSINNTSETMNAHKLIVDTYVKDEFCIISTIGPDGEITHEEI